MEWQPIETAPRDYTEVLVYCGGDVFVANWEARAKEPHWNADICDLCGGIKVHPTHWMPLPKPPAHREGE